MPPPGGGKKPNPKTKPRPTIGVTKGSGPCSSPGCPASGVLVQVQCSNCVTYICQQHDWNRNNHHLHGVRECSGPCENMYCSACDEMELCRVCHMALCEDCSSQNLTLTICSICDSHVCDPDSRSGFGRGDCAVPCAKCGNKVCDVCLKEVSPCVFCSTDPLCLNCLKQCSNQACETAACEAHKGNLAAQCGGCKKCTCHLCYEEGGGRCFGCKQVLPAATHHSGRTPAEVARVAAVMNGSTSPTAASAATMGAPAANGGTTVFTRIAAGDNGGVAGVSVTTNSSNGEVQHKEVLSETEIRARAEELFGRNCLGMPSATSPAAGAAAATAAPAAAAQGKDPTYAEATASNGNGHDAPFAVDAEAAIVAVEEQREQVSKESAAVLEGVKKASEREAEEEESERAAEEADLRARMREAEVAIAPADGQQAVVELPAARAARAAQFACGGAAAAMEAELAAKEAKLAAKEAKLAELRATLAAKQMLASAASARGARLGKRAARAASASAAAPPVAKSNSAPVPPLVQPATAAAAGANGAAAASQQGSMEEGGWEVDASGGGAPGKRNKKKEKKAKKKGGVAVPVAASTAASAAAATSTNGFADEETAVDMAEMNRASARLERSDIVAAGVGMPILGESFASPSAADAAAADMGAAAAAGDPVPYEELRQYIIDVTLQRVTTTFQEITEKFRKRIEDSTIQDIFEECGGNCRTVVNQLAFFLSIEIPQQSQEEVLANAAVAAASHARTETNGAGVGRVPSTAAVASASNDAVSVTTNEWASRSGMSPIGGAYAGFGSRAAIGALVTGRAAQQQEQRISPMPPAAAALWQRHEADDACVDASGGSGDGEADVLGRSSGATAATAINNSRMHLRIKELLEKGDLRALELLADDIRGRAHFAEERKILKKSISELKRQREAALMARGIAPPKPKPKPTATAAVAAPAMAGSASLPAIANSPSFVLPEPPQGGGPNGYLSLTSPPHGCDDFWMPVWHGIVGWLIGPQGKRIKTIMNESGASVRVEPGLRAAKEKQQVHIWGHPASVRAAFDRIQDELLKAPSPRGAQEYFAGDNAAVPAPMAPAAAATTPAGSGYRVAAAAAAAGTNAMNTERMVGMLLGKVPAARPVSPIPMPPSAGPCSATAAATMAAPSGTRTMAASLASAGAGASSYVQASGSSGEGFSSRGGGGGGDGSSEYGSAGSDLALRARCQQLRRFLEQINIAEYYEAFVSGGWDLHSVLAADVNNDFAALKLKPGHKVRLRNAVNKARSQQPQGQQQNGTGKGAAAATSGGGVAAAPGPPAAVTAPVSGGGWEDDHSCVVCFDLPRTAMFLPCKHRCVCEGCADLIENSDTKLCPVCRLDYTQIIRKIYS